MHHCVAPALSRDPPPKERMRTGGGRHPLTTLYERNYPSILEDGGWKRANDEQRHPESELFASAAARPARSRFAHTPVALFCVSLTASAAPSKCSVGLVAPSLEHRSQRFISPGAEVAQVEKELQASQKFLDTGVCGPAAPREPQMQSWTDYDSTRHAPLAAALSCRTFHNQEGGHEGQGPAVMPSGSSWNTR
ncbi:uncharacterized protein LOC144108074 [Amblyomma americanum]